MNKDFKTMEDIFDDIKCAKRLYDKGNFQEAYNIISDIIPTIDMMVETHMQGENFGRKEYEAVYMLAGDICGELGSNKEALNNYFKHHFLQFQINHDFQGKDSLKLFKFSSTRKYTLNNLSKNEITLVDPRVQNDIVDSPIFQWLDSPLFGRNARYKKHLDALAASYNYLRETSFCTDSEDCRAVENTLMWAHYANSHKGICVEYELDKKDFTSTYTLNAVVLRLLKVDYVNPRVKEEILDFTNNETSLNLRTALATKSIDWQYENEVRMIAYVPNETSQYIQCYLDTINPIKAIYFGVQCPKQRENAVKKIFEHRPEVKFFKMKINPKNIHRLTFESC